MGKRYGHVTMEERCEIAGLQAAGIIGLTVALLKIL